VAEHHPTSTARTGAGAASLVVAGLPVHGIAGPRVVEASFSPTVTRGSTNVATYMVAAKAADLIAGR
jgi:choline dehydrogenase